MEFVVNKYYKHNKMTDVCILIKSIYSVNDYFVELDIDWYNEHYNCLIGAETIKIKKSEFNNWYERSLA